MKIIEKKRVNEGKINVIYKIEEHETEMSREDLELEMNDMIYRIEEDENIEIFDCLNEYIENDYIFCSYTYKPN